MSEFLLCIDPAVVAGERRNLGTEQQLNTARWIKGRTGGLTCNFLVFVGSTLTLPVVQCFVFNFLGCLRNGWGQQRSFRGGACKLQITNLCFTPSRELGFSKIRSEKVDSSFKGVEEAFSPGWLTTLFCSLEDEKGKSNPNFLVMLGRR